MAQRWCRRGTWLLVAVGLAIPLRAGHARPYPGVYEAAVVSGTVQRAAAGQLLVTPDQHRSRPCPTEGRLAFALKPDTQILWGTQRLTAAELQGGDAVMVRYHEQGGVKVAQVVWALLAQARELSPTETAEAAAEAAYARAQRLIEAGHFREALPYLGRALRLQPGYLAAYGRRGYVYATLAMMAPDDAAQQTYRERALEDFTAALHVDPTYVSAWQNRAQLRRALGDWEGALQDLTRVIGLEPEVGKWYCQRALLLRQRGRDDAAHEDFQRCLRLDPSLRERYPEATERPRRQPHG